MEEDEITWNLKGPKRMKKRRELNSLIRNNIKYKSLINSRNNPKSDSFNLSHYSSNKRLLKDLNNCTTSSEEEGLNDYNYSANKFDLKKEKQTHFCKIIQIFLIGSFVTCFVTITVILLFSYTKFHEILNDLKKEIETTNKEKFQSIDDLRQIVDQYSNKLKQLENKFESFSNKESNNESSLYVEKTVPKNEKRQKRNTFEELHAGTLKIDRYKENKNITSRINNHRIRRFNQAKFAKKHLQHNKSKILNLLKLSKDHIHEKTIYYLKKIIIKIFLKHKIDKFI